MIEGILFPNGVFTRLLGLFLDAVGVLTTVGVFTIGLVLSPGVAAGLFTGVAMVGLSKTFLDFHCGGDYGFLNYHTIFIPEYSVPN